MTAVTIREDNMRILLIADPPMGPKVRDHLSQYGEVDLYTPKEAPTTIPYGVKWVFVMNGDGRRVGTLAAAAGRVGAKCFAIPPGWSQIQPTLERSGFFKAAGVANGGAPRPRPDGGPLTQRPFAKIADAVAEERARREREENERKAREATEVGLGLRPLPEPPPEGVPVAEDPPPTVVETPAPEAPASPPATLLTEREEERLRRMTEMAVRARQAASEGKLALAEFYFSQNPNLSIDDAAAILAATSPDGRATSRDDLSVVRTRVRERKGLETGVRRRSVLTHREAQRTVTPFTPPPAAKAATADVPVVTSTSAGSALPADVEAATRLLREALEKSDVVDTYALTFKRGEKAKVRWLPLPVAFDLEF